MDLEKFCRTEYTIKHAFNLLDDVHGRTKVQWSDAMWEQMNIPKHMIIFWLALLERLRVRKKLWQLGIIREKHCLMCGSQEETMQHLFFLLLL